MIFNRDVLFIHVPKTGGMAVTECLLEALPKPVFYSHPHAHDPDLAARGVVQIPGRRHETAAMCRETMARHGHDFDALKLIIAVARDPYETEVSRYAYMQNGNAWDNGANQELAMEGDFEAFARESQSHGGGRARIEDYFEIDGHIPVALRVLRQENLEAELRAALAGAGIASCPALGRLNATGHGDWQRYYTRGAEEAVHGRYRWLFDRGYYKRLDPEVFAFAAPGRRFSDAFAPEGPVERLGLAPGYWSDTWVGGVLAFPVRCTEPLAGIRIEGGTPVGNTVPTQLAMRVGRREFRASFPAAQLFEWEIPVRLARHEAVEIELSASPTFCPHEVESGSGDRRALSFRLLRFGFTPAASP